MVTGDDHSSFAAAGVFPDCRALLESLEDQVLVIDTAYTVKSASPAFKHKSGTDIAGKTCYRLQGLEKPCHAPLWGCPLGEVLKTAAPRTLVHFSREHGGDSYLKITLAPLRDAAGSVCGAIEIRRDVTAERALETQILRRHHQLSVLSQISSAVSGHHDLPDILRIALDSTLEIVNGDIGGILLEEGGVFRYRVHRGLSSRFAEEVRLKPGEGIAGRVAATGEPVLIEDLSLRPPAQVPDFASTEGIKGCVSIPLKSKGRVVGVLNIVSHIAGRFSADDLSLLSAIGDYLGTAIEQARLYQRLAHAGERYRTLLQHALGAQEDERKRIARELHDETSQAMTSLTLSLQAIMGMAEMKGIRDEELLDRLKKTHAYAVRAGNEVVKLMKELRPTLLDELGMPAAIQRYAKDTLQPAGISLVTEFVGTERRFRPEIEITLFRVTQGVIGNILEHSGAKNVYIKLECDDHRCLLNIRDDGRGFDVSKITQVDPGGRGAGLFTMKERVRLVGGVCHINSMPGKGTDIMVKVPLSGEALDEEDKGFDS